MNTDEITAWIWAMAVFAAALAVFTTPFAIVALRRERAARRREAFRAPEPTLSRRQQRIRDQFIATRVDIKALDPYDPLLDILRPDTAPIDLPNAHVPVEPDATLEPSRNRALPSTTEQESMMATAKKMPAAKAKAAAPKSGAAPKFGSPAWQAKYGKKKGK